MSLERHKREAFTLVELLVVIAIIGILIALLLPAVQAAREAARRSQCANNIKQLCLSLHTYCDVYRMLPINYGNPAVAGIDWGDARTSQAHSWMQCILPYVEQQPLYDMIRFGEPLSHPNNEAVSLTVVDTFLCPSDQNDGGIMDGRANLPGGGPDRRAVNNYKAVAGGNWAWGDAICHHTWVKARWPNDTNGLDRGDGIICRNYDNQVRNYTELAHITDGTSNTFAVGEAVPKWCNHTWWWWFNGCTATCGVPLNYVSDRIRANPSETLDTNLWDWPNNYSFMSRHPGGGNFGVCDGSVTFISETIDLMTYRHLANIGDAEPVQVP